MPSANPHGATLNHFISSNSTTQHFLGASQRGWMTGPRGSNASLGPSPPGRPVATRLAASSAPDIHVPDSTAVRPATQPPPMESLNGTQAAQTGHAQAPNVRWAMVNTSQPASVRKRSFETAFVQPGLPTASPVEQRQEAPSGPPPGRSTTFTTSTSLSSSNGITVETLPRLKAFLNQIRARGHLSDLVSCRASVLKDACIYRDGFYLYLHQIYCRATVDPLFTMQIGFSNEQLRGFDTVQTILLPNGSLPPDVLNFFASFPHFDPTHVSPMPGHIVAQVGAFLSGLERDWQELRQTCLGRGYPPFTDELRARLRLGSPVFQKVLFNSIHRQLIGLDSPVLAEQGLRLFDEDQRISRERLATNGYPPSDRQVQAEAQRLGSRYLSLCSALQQARPDISSVSSGPAAAATDQVVQHPNVTMPATAALPDYTLLTQNGGAPAWPPDAALLSQPQQLLDQSYPRAIHAQQPQMRRQHALAEMQQLHSQIAGNICNPVQQTQAPRGGQSPLSFNHQIGPSTASSAPPGRPVAAHNPTGNMAPSGVPRVAATAPPSVPNLSRKCNKLDTPYPPLLPPLGHEPIQGANQNYRIVALHQAHLRSPKYQVSDVQGTPQSMQRLYQVPAGFILLPQVLGYSCPYFRWQFGLSADRLQRRAEDLFFVPDLSNPSLAEPVRQVTSGSFIYRLKCVEVPAHITSALIREDVWVTRDTVWPTGIFFAVNEKQLEVRRKLHHGKDLALDLTKHVKEGQNILTCSLLRTTGEMKLDKNFAVAVEVIEIVSDSRIRELPHLLREAEAKEVVTKSLTCTLPGGGKGTDTRTAEDDDEEVLVMDAHISIDITDPYTAQIIELPVRGKTCLHRECFDLDTFLGTRKARTSDKDRETTPTSPDEWKCPICKRDARPQSLVVDGFLQQVRKDLEQRDRLDVKAIRVQADGSWEPVLDMKKPDRRASTNTDGAEGLASRRQSGTGPGLGVAPEEGGVGPTQSEVASMGQGPGPSEPVVIELD